MAKLGKRQAELAPVVEKIQRLENAEKQLAENKQMLNDPDPEIKTMALEEGRRLEVLILGLQSEIEELLLPKDAHDDKDAIVEIRAGAGGDESTLFAAELFRAYGKYAEGLGFKFHITSTSKSDAGGFKEVIFEIQGGGIIGAFVFLKYERGVPRGPRVP